MIRPTANNRQLIKDFLEKLSEDEFIDKVIIPLFNKNGYILYRLNNHGPGEHGKDIIFYRNAPLFFDQEFVVVQAKSEKVTASNVATYSNQLIRALRVPFSTKTGAGDRQANYVIFINSKAHTNDANFEFPYLIDGKNNIKILSQENVIELIINETYVPEELSDQLEIYDFAAENFEQEIKNTIYSKNPDKIKYLFSVKLKIETTSLSKEIKEFLINYIFLTWDEDRSWNGTVLPMKWLNQCFHFIQPSQYKKLFQVVEEYASSTHSFDAYADTCEIVKKLKPIHIKAFESNFIELLANRALNYRMADFPILFDKLDEFVASNKVGEQFKDICNVLIDVNKLRKKILKSSDSKKMKKEKQALKDNIEKISDYLD